MEKINVFGQVCLKKILEVTERRWELLLEEFSSISYKLFIFSIIDLQYFRRLSKSEIKKLRSDHAHRFNKQILYIKFVLTHFTYFFMGKIYTRIRVCSSVRFLLLSLRQKLIHSEITENGSVFKLFFQLNAGLKL